METKQIGGRQSSLDPSTRTILWPRVRIPSATYTLFQFIFELLCEKNENKKRPGLGLFEKKLIDGLTNWQRANPLSSTVGTFLSLKVFSEYTTYQIEACLMMPMLTYLSEYSGYPGNVCLWSRIWWEREQQQNKVKWKKEIGK